MAEQEEEVQYEEGAEEVYADEDGAEYQEEEEQAEGAEAGPGGDVRHTFPHVWLTATIVVLAVHWLVATRLLPAVLALHVAMAWQCPGTCQGCYHPNSY